VAGGRSSETLRNILKLRDTKLFNIEVLLTDLVYAGLQIILLRKKNYFVEAEL